MKKLMLSLIAAAMTVGVPAVANEAHHPDQSKPAAVQPGPDSSPPAASQDGATMMGMMDAMHRQMEQLRNMTDPKDREKLLQEHMQGMHEMMVTMHGMGDAKDRGGMMTDQGHAHGATMMEQIGGQQPATDGERK